jgi:MFS family permease
MGIRYSFGIFFTSLETEFSWTRSITSTLFSIYILFSAATSVIGGWALDRFGPKPVFLVMGIFSGISLFLSGQAQSALQLYICYSVLLSIGTGALYTVLTATISRWFITNRATALGLLGTGVNIGTLTIAPVAAWFISSFDWRIAFVWLGIIAFVCMVPAAMFVRKAPYTGEPLPSTHGSSHAIYSDDRFSIRQYLLNHNFQILFYAWFACSICLHIIMNHVVPMAGDMGMSSLEAAGILMVFSITSIPSRIVVANIADRISKRKIAIASVLLQSAAIIFLAYSSEPWMFYMFAVMYGLVYAGSDAPLTALIASTFGLKRLGTITSLLSIGWCSGAALGPYFAGFIFDVAGSYQIALFTGAALLAGTALFIRFLRD